eukprot:SAG31_NODE_443_length_15645_cov_51.693169_6_plen_1007_part_00
MVASATQQLLLLCGVARPVTSATIGWASDPVMPGEHVSLAGGGFTPQCKVELLTLSSNATTFQLAPLQPTNASMKVLVPAGAPLDAYRLTVSGCNAALGVKDSAQAAAVVVVNRADPWWVQSDGGDFASAGGTGWIRIFGKSLSFMGSGAAETQNVVARRRRDDMEQQLKRAVDRRDFAAASTLAAALNENVLKSANHHPAKPTQMRLTALSMDLDSGAAPIVLTSSSVAEDAMFSAKFRVPDTVRPGKYSVEVSNGFGSEEQWVELSSFLGPGGEANTSSNVVIVQRARQWTNGKNQVFNVSSYGCAGTIACDSTAAVAAALSAADRNGGGVVYFPRGQYYLMSTDDGIQLGPGVTMQGEGMDLTAVYFKEQQPNNESKGFTAAPGSYINYGSSSSDIGSTGPNRIEDIAFYITCYYNSLVNIPVQHDGFQMRRVRVRAVAFHAGDETKTPGRGPPGKPGRVSNFTYSQLGPLIHVFGKNWEVSDCDLYASDKVFRTDGPVAARYGLVARNRIWFGSTVHWFDQIKQVIFEHNAATGVSLVSGGSNIDTYGSGTDGTFAQHIYFAHNSMEQVWGFDREIMTTDNLGGFYSGHIASVNGTRLTLPSPPEPPIEEACPNGCSVGIMRCDSGSVSQKWRYEPAQQATLLLQHGSNANGSQGICLNVQDYGTKLGDKVWATFCRPEEPRHDGLYANDGWTFSTLGAEDSDGKRQRHYLVNTRSNLCLGDGMLVLCNSSDVLYLTLQSNTGLVLQEQLSGDSDRCLAVKLPGHSTNTAALGGSVAVLDGAGAGDYRRIAGWEGHTITLDRPFSTQLDGTSFINIGPFRGRALFNHNRYTDGGSFQLYAYAMDFVVASMRMERTEAILSWGRAGAGSYCSNLHNQFFDNFVVEGNHVFNYNGSYLYPHGKVIEPYFFGMEASDQFDANLTYKGPINRQIVWRRNQILSNGGLAVRGNTADVLVENTQVANSSVGVTIGPASCQYSPRPGAPRNGCSLYTQNDSVLITAPRF